MRLFWRNSVTSHPRRWSLRAVLWAIPSIVILIFASHLYKGKVVAGAGLRTAVIKRGTFLHSIRITGSTQAVRAYVVQAPQLAGGGSAWCWSAWLTPVHV